MISFTNVIELSDEDTHTHSVVRLTSHHGDHAGSVDVGERAELSDSQDGLHVGGATSLPKLTDLVVHGCRGRHKTEITRRIQCTPVGGAGGSHLLCCPHDAVK